MNNKFESGPRSGEVLGGSSKEAHQLPKKPNLNIVGITSGGKSSVGKSVAEALGMNFVDADKAFEEKFGTVTSVVDVEGWGGMRLKEKKVVQELSKLENTVIAWGGGVVEDDEHNTDQRNENAIYLAASGVTIWLEVSPKKAARRAELTQDPNRRIDGDLEKTLTTRLANRQASYANVSDYRVSNEGPNPQDAVDAIVCAVNEQGILKDKKVITI